jgi:outer membrane protein OmpA-like peptidoglycan-associated protein
MAQSEEIGARWGEGADRICNVVVDTNRNPVIQNNGVVIQNQTADCPEVVAMVEPAAPPAPLPASGLLLFDFDKYDLNTDAQAALDDIVFDIKDRELGGIMVGGHTDTAGPPDYNMTLSQQRANTVATELIKNGIPARIVTTEAFGETDLAVPTPDNTPDQANRRVTVDFSR